MQTVKLDRTCICVGGPLDGKRFDAPGATFRVPVRIHDLDGDKENTEAVLDGVYREMVFHTPGGSISLWAETGASELTIMQKVLLRYMKPDLRGDLESAADQCKAEREAVKNGSRSTFSAGYVAAALQAIENNIRSAIAKAARGF